MDRTSRAPLRDEMTLLAFETSCDETSAAVVRDGEVLSSVVSSQIRLHSEYGGVVPELAVREHLRNLMPVTEAALKEAGTSVDKIDAVAATQGPGLPSALMVGLKAGQGMSFALRKPFIGVHHHEAHLYSPWIGGSPPRAHFDQFEPNVSLIVSGGHTMLVQVEAELKYLTSRLQLLGIADAAPFVQVAEYDVDRTHAQSLCQLVEIHNAHVGSEGNIHALPDTTHRLVTPTGVLVILEILS